MPIVLIGIYIYHLNLFDINIAANSFDDHNNHIFTIQSVDTGVT